MMKRLIEDEYGGSAIEYGLILALISIGCIIAFVSLGINLAEMFFNIANAIAGR